MDTNVTITFDCIPLRSVSRFDRPVDATDEQQALYERLRRAAQKHGTHNTFYLCNAECVFRLTNHPSIGLVQFMFEGTVLTDATDTKTLSCDLTVELGKENCDWLIASAVTWLKETVVVAVRHEFDRYIAAGDLQRTVERMESLHEETSRCGGFLGMGL